MNICMFGASFLPRRGGMEYVIHHLSNALVEQGHSVTVIAAKASWSAVQEGYKYRLIRYGMPVKGFGRLGGYHVCAVLAFGICNALKPFDILHCHSASYAGSRARTIKKLFRKIPLIVTPHGEDVQRVPEINYGLRLDKKWDHIIRKNLKSADIVTAISLSVENELNFLERMKIRRVPNGVHLATYATEKKTYLREHLHIDDEKVIFLSVGRSHIKKGYTYGIKAIASLVRSHGEDNVHYVIVGKGTSDHEDLVRALGMENHISLIEEISPDDVRECYASADVFFSPSIIEGLSLVSIEAVASGLPLVVTDVPGNIDIVESTAAGFVARSGDIEDMSRQLAKFMNVETRKEYAGKARASAKVYDWSTIARQYIQVYEESMSARR